VLQTAQFEVDPRDSSVRNDMVVESGDPMHGERHNDVRLDAEYFLSNDLLNAPRVEFLQFAIWKIENPHLRELQRRLHILHLAMARRAHLLHRPAELMPHLCGFAPGQCQEIDVVPLTSLCRHGTCRPK